MNKEKAKNPICRKTFPMNCKLDWRRSVRKSFVVWLFLVCCCLHFCVVVRAENFIDLRSVPVSVAVEVYSRASGKPLLISPDCGDKLLSLQSTVEISSVVVMELLQASFQNIGLEVVSGKSVDRLLPLVIGRVVDQSLPIAAFVKVIRLNHALPLFLSSLVATGDLSGLKVDVDNRLRSLIVRGASNEVENYSKLVASLDIGLRTVTVEAIITEVNCSTNNQSGIDIFNRAVRSAGSAIAGGLQGSLAGNGAAPVNLFSAIPSPANILGNGAIWGTINGIKLDLLLKFLSSDSSFNILSKPIITVLDGETALLSIGQNIPYVGQATSYNQNTIAAVSTQGLAMVTASSVNFLDLSTTLRIRPKVGNDDLIELDIEQDANSLGGYVQLPTGQVPISNNRKLHTVTMVNSGSIMLLGGLISKTDSKASEGVPGLRKLPIFGLLGSERSASSSKSELLIFLRAKINEN